LFVEKLFRTAQNKISQIRRKQKEGKEKKKYETTSCRVKKSKKFWSKKQIFREYGPTLPPPPHPQPPKFSYFALGGFVRVIGRGSSWQIL
jgi:hypothetical protein